MATVSAVRLFNRFYTQSMGVLKDQPLNSGLTLAQARVLFELGELGPMDMPALRVYLGLDAGCLSRILAVLSKSALIRTAASPTDRRAREVVLTPQGRSKLHELDDRSEELVTRRIERLDTDAQRRLVDCMAEIRRLLSDEVEIVPRPADGPEARACLAGYYCELARRFPQGFEPARSTSADPHETSPPVGAFLVIRSGGLPRGCGALKTLETGVGEIKRMWIHAELRGLGIARQLLAALEARALELGHHTLRLDTSSHLVEAISLYRSSGYVDIKAYNENPYAARWFEKRL